MTDNDRYMADLQHRVERAHRAIPGANDPAADVWQRAKSQIRSQDTREESNMSMSSTLTVPSTPVPVFTDTTRPVVRRFANVAAILLMVAIMAFGGWFSMGQLNQPPPNPRFAALDIQEDDAGNGVCDVESLTVDEAILILQDPMGSLALDLDDPVEAGYPKTMFDRRQVTVRDPFLYVADLQNMDIVSLEMYESAFTGAQPVINEFLDCMSAGTVSQMWKLMDPITVQYRLHVILPTLVSEEEARALLPEILARPATFSSAAVEAGPVVPWVQINPDVTQSRYVASNGFYGFGGWAVSPVQFLDENGAVVMEPDLRGYLVSDQEKQAEFSINIVYGQSSLDMQWYVIDVFFPFNVPGWQ